MPHDLDTQALEQRARALLDDRITAVRALAKARKSMFDKRDALAAAEREDAAAYQAAVRAGWTDDELKKVGFDAPTRKAPGRARRTRSTSQRAQRLTESDAAPTSDATGHVPPEQD